MVGLELLGAGLRGARLNVEINLPGLKDPAYVAKARDEAGRLNAEADTAVPAARARLASSQS
jgi:formiminotetrahydrofolate cyclodeaminase